MTEKQKFEKDLAEWKELRAKQEAIGAEMRTLEGRIDGYLNNLKAACA